MIQLLRQLWQEDDGVLSFEWVLLATLLAIGIVGGLAAARDGFIDEMGDIAEGIICLDQSYTIDGGGIWPDINYMDEKSSYSDCARATAP
jgi:Flp pilus assembly pilin Flp